MIKTCKHPTCKGKCRRIKVLKKKPKPLKKVSFKQGKKNRQKSKLTKKDKVFFQEIWEEREHIDFETEQPIYGEARSLYFHHVLPKRAKHLGGYPEFRYKKWNIVLVSWETHTKTENNIDLTPKIKAYRDHLLKTYVK